MASNGIKIAKSAYTVSDPDQKMILTSKFPALKLFEYGEDVLSKASGDDIETVTINHNLGYVPQVYVFGKYLDENDYPSVTVVNRYKRWSHTTTPGLRLWERYRYYADSTNLYIIFTTDAYVDETVNLDYMYYIFYDPAS